MLRASFLFWVRVSGATPSRGCQGAMRPALRGEYFRDKGKG